MILIKILIVITVKCNNITKNKLNKIIIHFDYRLNSNSQISFLFTTNISIALNHL